ncbi:acyl-CoA dehydrogenase [Pseudomonas sp. N-137]|uniref:acyl-CoA dehydrogenase n=1 Tax=Pseudomonas sp. N-137 TaxID=3108452 RepID=UPI002ADECEC2|nr:acyl-CoA dehydrogenase [Pseudomonas sp. N-137]MEA1028078.1 acyl-CoA dehydrogenase [Pseudomonas sp. N-137]
MNPYIAPLEDMRFVLRELADIGRVAQLPDADSLADEELTDAILEQASRFAEEVLVPVDAVGDRHGARWSAEGVTTAPGFSEAYRQFTEAGWNNIEIPIEHGGQGLPTMLCAAVEEVFTSANKSFCFCPGLTAFAVKALAASANEEVRSRFLPKLVSGEWAATMNLTEPQAGSDVGALRTRAVEMPDGTYRISGQKIFISYGDHDLTENIVHLVLARMPGAPEGTKGISLFVVPKFLPTAAGGVGERNDVVCAGIEHKMGNHGSPTCTMVYGGAGEGAVGWLVGEQNKGLQAMFVMVNAARFNVGMESLAMSERAYQLALSYARERVQGSLPGQRSEPVPIIRHPDVRRMLMLMRSQTEAMRALAYLISGARDLAAHHVDAKVRNERQAFVDLMIPVFKGWSSEAAIEVTSMAIQVYGGMGYVLESGASQPMRDVRICAIYEGTTSIQAHDFIERKLVRDGGAALQAWLAEVDLTLGRLAVHQNNELLEIECNLRKGVELLRRATDWAILNYSRQPLVVLGGGVSLLQLCGIVAGGWQMARAALVALNHIESGKGHADFLRRKLLSARFYAAHVLPQVAGLAEVAMRGGEFVMAMDDAAF